METMMKGTSIFSKRMKFKSDVGDFIAYIFIFIFMYTAYDKVLGFSDFKEFIQRLNYMHEIGIYVAWLIPGSEFLISLFLLFAKARQIGLYASLSVMFVFTTYLIHMRLTVAEKELPCHCGGFIENLSWDQHIWFNIALIILSIIGIRINKSFQIKVIEKSIASS